MKIADVIKEGQAVDAIGVTKGKGIQGPVNASESDASFTKLAKRSAKSDA